MRPTTKRCYKAARDVGELSPETYAIIYAEYERIMRETSLLEECKSDDDADVIH